MVNDAGGQAAAVVLDIATPRSYYDLRLELARARYFGFKVNAVGTRHSQGGQTCQGGTVHIDMRHLARVKVQADDTVWAGAGATWHDVIAALRRANSGRTVQVMQASSIFTGIAHRNDNGYVTLSMDDFISCMDGYSISNHDPYKDTGANPNNWAPGNGAGDGDG
ncbi:MAG TPA: FAD-binding protein [Myxococcota bacterium]|nr:FAD-binding protein [Myxococcota bacterium]